MLDVEKPGNVNETLSDVYVLNFMVTLDNMGTAQSTRGEVAYDPSQHPKALTDAENYINPERFRVLFFDDNNWFMFESKNRWLKRVDDNDNFSSWYVSVPLGPFGNDSYGSGKEYDWDNIHSQLTSGKFKIAILANRPHELQYPGFIDSQLSLPDGLFKNDGPVWGPDDAGKKSLLDLHHCQYDIIYYDKGNPKDASEKNFYDFVMGDYTGTRPTMGASIHWASFDYGDTDKVVLNGSTNMRHIKMPSVDHPIPMYGIQEFDPIPTTSWKPGTPFDLSNEPQDAFPDFAYSPKAISLLRSCVRVDFKIPKSVKSTPPTHISLWYSNIYSRCEPMNTWTPTDQLWSEDRRNCEWELIRDHGLISTSKYGDATTSKNEYQKNVAWFFGAWEDPTLPAAQRWQFNINGGGTMKPSSSSAVGSAPYPQIFNTCIQRNKVLTLERANVSDLYNDGYWHYVYYTGERNMNDPNNIYNMGKNPYIETIIISWDKKTFYCIPLVQYGVNNDVDLGSTWGPHVSSDSKKIMYESGSWPSIMDTYINSVKSETNKNNFPYPLVRNHVYSFTLKGTKGEDDLDAMTISSEVLQTPDINFSGEVKKRNYKHLAPTFKVNERSELKIK